MVTSVSGMLSKTQINTTQKYTTSLYVPTGSGGSYRKFYTAERDCFVCTQIFLSAGSSNYSTGSYPLIKIGTNGTVDDTTVVNCYMFGQYYSGIYSTADYDGENRVVSAYVRDLYFTVSAGEASSLRGIGAIILLRQGESIGVQATVATNPRNLTIEYSILTFD